ncbi:MAG: hypothetical protein IPK82_43525 [Polyangiaceae bacterium]|nr:hypothetical protein [Polyangiaceae bacterium]
MKNGHCALFVALLFCSIFGCQEVQGECWSASGEGQESGAGGGTILPSTGGFGDVPPEPQGADGASFPCVGETTKTEQPHEETSGDSCGDIPQGVGSEGNTYAQCSGTCEIVCQSIGAGAFSAAAFPFATVVPDDGAGESGGWQAATAGLKFVRWTSLFPETWTCTVRVGMPLRTAFYGKISAESAATISANVATQAAAAVRRIEPPLPQGIFAPR